MPTKNRIVGAGACCCMLEDEKRTLYLDVCSDIVGIAVEKGFGSVPLELLQVYRSLVEENDARLLEAIA